ncbi:MAG: DUF262 domain-containing HNH endonuclease family protein [Alphaproteobacteria bacterium]|nr:DUF262 domain-containing HNH endonuclease family protein [Alphaproteobacteria bacterium]
MTAPNYIEVRSLTLRDLFSGAYVFQLPWFQRAYAWQTDQVSRLLGDLFSALEAEGDSAEYFLGTLLVCRPDGSTETALIDGHQRAMTLTILFSVLRDLCADQSEKAELDSFVKSTDYHLRPQDVQAEFCKTYVQQMGGTSLYPEALFEQLSYSERNAINSRDFIKERLSASEISPEMRTRLAKFLADRCHVIVHHAPNQEEAWVRLRKEEETRLDFSSVDLAKASLLSVVQPSERDQCALVWEEIEGLIGPNDLYFLLCHLRTLKSRRARNKPLEEEISHAFKLNKNGLGFMTDVFLPAARRVQALRAGEAGTSAARDLITQLCRTMSWIEEQTWVPVALCWLEQHGDKHPETIAFFKALERLLWMMKLSLEGPERLHPRLMKVISQIENGTAVADMDSLVIERKMQRKVLEKLRGPYFDRRAYRAEALRRIAITEGDDPGPIDGVHATIEHVLPRGWKLQNAWRVEFPDRARVDAHAHSLGNLTYLSFADNNRAASQEFVAKNEIYAKSEFKMTRDIAQQATWVQSDIEARTERMIALLFADWDLKVS